MLGHETVAAGIAGPEIADDVVGKIGRRFRGYHGVRTNRACRQIRSARIGMGRDGRQDFSSSCHRDLLTSRNTRRSYSNLFEDVATQMRSIYVIWRRYGFAMQRIRQSPDSDLHARHQLLLIKEAV